jgi:hypothetical protein
VSLRFFADDTRMFVPATEIKLHQAKAHLAIYEFASGQLSNLSKSKVILFGLPIHPHGL